MNHCDYDRWDIADLTPEIFQKEYFLKKPVIVSNATFGWPAIAKWTKQRLKTLYDDTPILVGRSESITRHGGSAHIKTTMGDFLNELDDVKIAGQARYMFDHTFVQREPSLAEDFNVPKYFPGHETTNDFKMYFLIGSSQSGVTFHSHGDGWQVLVHGKKRWFMYPKGKSAFSNPGPGAIGRGPGGTMTTEELLELKDQLTPKNIAPEGLGFKRPGQKGPEQHDWCVSSLHQGITFLFSLSILIIFKNDQHKFRFMNSYPKLREEDKPLECIQYAGEMVYIPEMWDHATINIGQSIGIAGQLQKGETPENKYGIIARSAEQMEQFGKVYQCPSLSFSSALSYFLIISPSRGICYGVDRLQRLLQECLQPTPTQKISMLCH